MKILICTLLLSSLLQSGTRAQIQFFQFGGMCDASAMEMLSDDLFVVGNDEDNVLRVYSRAKQGFPVQTIDFSRAFAIKKKKTPEMDLEAAARIGDRIYWISSHGANSKGKVQPSRHRLFATEVFMTTGVSRIRVVGRLYTDLVRDLSSEPQFARLNLVAASLNPPKHPGALNIEGLSPTPEGHLLIGFRNPIPAGRALIVRLKNPEQVISGQKPQFAPPQFIDLGGFGARSITPHENGYLIVAGPFDTEGGPSRLHFWDGMSEKTNVLPVHLPGNPEGISVIKHETTDSLFVISDDGAIEVAGSACKKLKDNSLKSFRAYEVQIPTRDFRAASQK